MRRAMEYVRWELDNWRAQRHGRDVMSFITGSKKVASYLWKSWKRGALVVLLLAFSPILFPLVLFLSFLGFISAVPLLCGAAAYYFIFRSFSLPLCITEFFYPSSGSSEVPITGEDRIPESAPLVVQEVEVDESQAKTSTSGKEGAEDLGMVSDAKAILVLGCELAVNEREEVDSREHASLNVPSECKKRNRESGAGSTSSVLSHSNAVLQVRGPIFLLPSAKLKNQRKEPGEEEHIFSVTSAAIQGEPAVHEETKSSTTVSAIDVPVGGFRDERCSFEPVCGSGCTPERSHVSEMDGICGGGTCHGSFIVEGNYGEKATAESVFIQHTGTAAPTAESADTHGRDYPAGNRATAGNPEVKTKASVSPTFSPNFSHSALLTTPEATARADSQAVPARYWRDEVEDTVLSSAFANIACVENWSSGASGDMACLLSWNSGSEKMMMGDQDVVSLLECSGEAEVFSASQNRSSGQYKEKNYGRTGSFLRFATSLFTHQRRLSFSNVLADDEMASPGFFHPTEKFNDCTPDCKKRSVSTSFSSDYTWPSESSEQGFELLSTRGTAYEDSCVDTDSSTAQYEEEESDLEPGVVSDSTFFPTPDQLTEDWETRRKRWEEESTPGRLAPLSPYIEARSVEARSMCNPLFEFSTPSPPLKKLKTEDQNHISDLPSSHTRFSERHSTPPEPGSTLSPRQECASGLQADRLESNTKRHTRSYSASFTGSLEPNSGEFEGLLGYWRRRDKTAHSLTSSPRHSPAATSPAETAHQIREEIDAIQMKIEQEIPTSALSVERTGELIESDYRYEASLHGLCVSL